SNDWPIDTSLMQAYGTRASTFLGRCKCRHDSFYIGQIHGSEVDVSHLIVEYYKLSALMISHRCPVDVSGLVWINDRPGQIDNILPSQGFGTSSPFIGIGCLENHCSIIGQIKFPPGYDPSFPVMGYFFGFIIGQAQDPGNDFTHVTLIDVGMSGHRYFPPYTTTSVFDLIHQISIHIWFILVFES